MMKWILLGFGINQVYQSLKTSIKADETNGGNADTYALASRIDMAGAIVLLTGAAVLFSIQGAPAWLELFVRPWW